MTDGDSQFEELGVELHSKRRTFMAATGAGLGILGTNSAAARRETTDDPTPTDERRRTVAGNARFADTVLFNGQILTVDDAFSVADGVAIRDGRFVAVGGRGDVKRLAGPNTEEIDLGGRTVVPGLVDSHLHMLSVGLDLAKADLFDARSVADVIAVVEAEAQETPAGEWVQTSSSWHEGQLDEKRLPTRDDLDPVSPDNPVFVPRGGHVCTVNSAALDLAGIDASTDDPAGGTIVRDPDTGEPTGVLLETARDLVEGLIPEPTREERKAAIPRAMGELNARGVTAALEPGLSIADMRAYMEFRTTGTPTVRTDMLARVHSIDDVDAATSHYARGFGDGMLKVGGMKYLIDGGVEGAALHEPYEIVDGVQEDPTYRGHLILPPGGRDEYREMLELAADRGFQVQTHAVGDRAIDLVMEEYAAVDESVDVGDLRWAVMHNFLPTEWSMEQMAALDVVATVQNHPTRLGFNQLEWWGDDRGNYAIPIRDLLDAGVAVAGGTDANVVPWRPFESLWWMVTRQTVGAGTLGADQAISREEALRLWTIGSAYAMHWEDEIGSIEPGKLADLAVLDTDYLRCAADDIVDVSVDMTMVGGDIVHRT
ncbi:amidohydrolase [Halovivax cerinus]|uniref:Amidohydrolase n=1 Tax=Halovivax cerinus TaxID=1487865 RepID=A0ABD5NJW5_9EURY|nr:amidohydrolase [Halovivax cerinus]